MAEYICGYDRGSDVAEAYDKNDQADMDYYEKRKWSHWDRQTISANSKEQALNKYQKRLNQFVRNGLL